MFEATRAIAQKYGPKVAFVSGIAALGAPAFAVDPASALEAVQTLSGNATGFGPVMWGLAIAGVSIMIGVTWIKRARGAN